MSLRAATAVAVAGVVAVLGGCGPAGEPVVSPSVSVSAVVTPSPSPTLSHEEQMLALIPEEAKGDDLFAAEAMAKFFISLHPGLYQGDDPALWEFLCLPESLYCSTSLEDSAERLAQGERQVGGAIGFYPVYADTLLDLDDPAEPAFISFPAYQEHLHVVNAEGDQIRERERYDVTVTMEMRFVEGLWRVFGVHIEASSDE